MVDFDLSRLDRLSADLVVSLTAALPDEWLILPAEGETTTALDIVLYYEQGDLVSAINGGPVPRGHVGVEFTLTLAAPEADPEQGTKSVTDAVVLLLPALDGLPNLYWDTAERVRLTTGETAYRLAVVNLSKYSTPTTSPEPDIEPDPMPEEA